jgi:hypothetical protein
MAEGLFGQGFQIDVMADMHNVTPAGCNYKLPHFSRWPAPHASGWDALAQDWSGMVGWCNPPFALLERIICLLRTQRATAAVVVPLKSKARWSRWAQEGAEGVIKVWPFDPQRRGFRMLGRSAPQTYSSGYAVVFFDFRTSDERRQGWRPMQGARQLRLRHEIDAAEVALGKRAPAATTYARLLSNGDGVVGSRGGREPRD